MRKRILILGVIFLIGISLIACNNQDDKEINSVKEPQVSFERMQKKMAAVKDITFDLEIDESASVNNGGLRRITTEEIKQISNPKEKVQTEIVSLTKMGGAKSSMKLFKKDDEIYMDIDGHKSKIDKKDESAGMANINLTSFLQIPIDDMQANQKGRFVEYRYVLEDAAMSYFNKSIKSMGEIFYPTKELKSEKVEVVVLVDEYDIVSEATVSGDFKAKDGSNQSYEMTINNIKIDGDIKIDFPDFEPYTGPPLLTELN